MEWARFRFRGPYFVYRGNGTGNVVLKVTACGHFALKVKVHGIFYIVNAGVWPMIHYKHRYMAQCTLEVLVGNILPSESTCMWHIIHQKYKYLYVVQCTFKALVCGLMYVTDSGTWYIVY